MLTRDRQMRIFLDLLTTDVRTQGMLLHEYILPRTRTRAAAASHRRLRHGRRSMELTGLRATNAPMSVLSDPLH